jgi:hypothetical protein
MSLIDKIKKARETQVEAGGYTFTVRRPTDMEVIDIRGSDQLKQGDIMQRFVLGWSGVTELDIIPGGSNTPVEFDTALFMEWVADRPQLWAPITSAILEAYGLHQQRLDDALKKPAPG